MESNRRTFLKIASIAGAAAGLKGVTSAFSSPTSDTAEKQKKAAAAEQIRVLTQDGKLVCVPTSEVTDVSEPRITVSNLEARAGIAGKKFVMVFDLSKCDGCGKCTQACQKMHFTPPDREWIKVFKMQDSETTAPYWFPKPCFHCDNPPCTKVCPVNATFKRQDGIVLIDNTRCIGCRFCIAACPYSSRFFNWTRPVESDAEKNIPYSPERGFPRRVGTTEKCDFCADMIRAGSMPHCVSACPMDAIYFGDENENAVTNHAGETVSMSALLEDNAGYKYMEELGTKPRVYYLPPKNRKFPKPETNKKAEGMT